MPLSGRFVISTVNILLHLANWEKFRKIYPRQVREAVNKKLTGTVLHFILALCLMWFSQYFSFISYKRDLELLSSLPLFFQLNRDGIWFEPGLSDFWTTSESQAFAGIFINAKKPRVMYDEMVNVCLCFWFLVWVSLPSQVKTLMTLKWVQ